MNMLGAMQVAITETNVQPDRQQRTAAAFMLDLNGLLSLHTMAFGVLISDTAFRLF